MAKSFAGLGATIIDASADLPSSPVEGLMVFQKDTNELKIYDGASWISMLDTDTPPALVYLNTTTMNSATTSVSNVFSSTYDSYRIIVSFANATSTTRGVSLRFRTSSDDTSANYWHYQTFVYGASGATGTGGGSSATAAILCSIGSTTAGQSIVFDIMNPNTSSLTAWAGSSATYQSDVTSTVFRVFGGTMNTSTQYTGFSILGTTDALNGTIRVYGYRNSI